VAPTTELNTRQLRHFLAVLDTGSLSAAAETQHLSQLALSRSIRALEERLGVPLFDRNDRRLYLTPFAHAYAPRARRMVSDEKEADRTLALMKAGELGSLALGRIFEVDLPATQQWKQARLLEAGIAVPPSLHFVPVDFERIGLAEGLARAGFDANAPAIFSRLGVTMYLDEAAVIDTLRFIAGCAKGSAVLFEYVMPLSSLPPIMRIAMEQLTARFAERGEPWKSFFEPAALAEMLTALGFSSSTWTPNELNRRYLANRADGLHISATPARLILATV